MKDEHSIAALCRHLAVSPSGYYDWQQRRAHPGPRAVVGLPRIDGVGIG